MAADDLAETAPGLAQAFRADVVLAEGQQQVRAGLVGVEPHGRVEGTEGLLELAAEVVLAAHEEVVEWRDRRVLSGPFLLTRLGRRDRPPWPGNRPGGGGMPRSARGAGSAARSRIRRPAAGSTSWERKSRRS